MAFLSQRSVHCVAHRCRRVARTYRIPSTRSRGGALNSVCMLRNSIRLSNLASQLSQGQRGTRDRLNRDRVGTRYGLHFCSFLFRPTRRPISDFKKKGTDGISTPSESRLACSPQKRRFASCRRPCMRETLINARTQKGCAEANQRKPPTDLRQFGPNDCEHLHLAVERPMNVEAAVCPTITSRP
jgi:hypothetical protein